jgi:5-hydroxyisourate hydrolase
MSAITTHVLDVALGQPAAGIPVSLEHQAADGSWKILGNKATDRGGRVTDLLPEGKELEAGAYRLTFETASYHRGKSRASFFPQVTVTFTVEDATQHYHVPLLLSPYGYSTYRGS